VSPTFPRLQLMNGNPGDVACVNSHHFCSDNKEKYINKSGNKKPEI
jgi:hypothetical protein